MIKRLIAALFIAATCHAQMDDYPWIGLLDAQRTNGMIAYYTFNRGNATAEIGSNLGVSNGAAVAWSTGYNGMGASFDGVNDTINGGISSLNGLGACSAMAWVNVSPSLIDVNGRVIGGRGAGNGLLLIVGKPPNTLVTFSIDTATGDAKNEATVASIPTNAWTHLAATYSATNADVLIYINGTAMATTTNVAGTGNIAHDQTVFHIGFETAAARAFKGNIDEVSIWNRKLTQAEITEAYKVGRILNPIGR